jgi:hypothetical protein
MGPCLQKLYTFCDHYLVLDGTMFTEVVYIVRSLFGSIDRTMLTEGVHIVRSLFGSRWSSVYRRCIHCTIIFWLKMGPCLQKLYTLCDHGLVIDGTMLKETVYIVRSLFGSRCNHVNRSCIHCAIIIWFKM